MTSTIHANSSTVSILHDTTLTSKYLHRKIVLDIILPPSYTAHHSYPILIMNDGQDLGRLKMDMVLNKAFIQQKITPFILVAIHCGERIQEYGVASQPDYKKRGAKADVYTSFILEELLPYIKGKYSITEKSEETVFCGFSLGGLSAFDIVWNHPQIFGKVGVFSGSFWWRQKAYQDHYSDQTDRIAHNLVRHDTKKTGLKFWLQTGTDDEKEDRNKNGIIDSIDDTLDLIAELEKKGYKKGEDIKYVEVEGGQHNQETWSAIMPDFLKWAFETK